MKKLSLLGSTGSIGTQTLDVVRTNCDIQVEALAAGSNITLLLEQIKEFKPKLVCVYHAEKAKELEEIIKKEQKARKFLKNTIGCIGGNSTFFVYYFTKIGKEELFCLCQTS